MTLDIEFEEIAQELGAEFEENEQTLNVEFGEVQRVGGIGETVPEWAKQPEKPTYHISEIRDSIGEYVGGTTQTPYTIDPQSLEIVLQEPVDALEGAEILNCYGGDREQTGIPDIDRNRAIGFMSQASGYATQALGNYSQSRGWWTIADGQCSIAEGLLSRTEGHFCHAEGTRTRATVNNAHTEGDMTEATGRQAHAEGASTKSTANCSHSEGYMSVSSGIASHAEGYGTIAAGQGQTAMGKYNISDKSNRLIVGIGSSDTSRKNGFTVSSSGAGWFASTVTSTGADYAEYFEWVDGNPNAEDRIGLIVTLDGDKIRLANSGDDFIGVVSGTAMVLGDNYEYEWKRKYMTDNYGRVIMDDPVEEFVEYTNYVNPADPSTWEIVRESIGYHAYAKISPDYNPDEQYINRAERSEWDIIGMMGKIHVRDDGSCTVGNYATVGDNGIATAATGKTNMRVMKRITDNIILVLMK